MPIYISTLFWPELNQFGANFDNFLYRTSRDNYLSIVPKILKPEPPLNACLLYKSLFPEIVNFGSYTCSKTWVLG